MGAGTTWIMWEARPWDEALFSSWQQVCFRRGARLPRKRFGAGLGAGATWMVWEARPRGEALLFELAAGLLSPRGAPPTEALRSRAWGRGDLDNVGVPPSGRSVAFGLAAGLLSPRGAPPAEAVRSRAWVSGGDLDGVGGPPSGRSFCFRAGSRSAFAAGRASHGSGSEPGLGLGRPGWCGRPALGAKRCFSSWQQVCFRRGARIPTEAVPPLDRSSDRRHSGTCGRAIGCAVIEFNQMMERMETSAPQGSISCG